MVLITGATGFLGSYLLCELFANGYSIRAVVRHSSSFENIEEVCKIKGIDYNALHESVQWVKGNLLDIDFVEEAMTDIDTIIHCAATVSFLSAQRKQMWATNVTCTANLVNQAVLNNCYFVHISSIAALGRSENNELITEETQWNNYARNSFYGKTKYTAECEVWRGIAEGMEAVILNPSVILGRGNWNTGSNMLFRFCRKGQRFYTAGMNAFVDVEDVVRIATAVQEKRISGERFIVSAENIYYRDLFTDICREFGKKTPSALLPYRLAKSVLPCLSLFSLLTGKKPLMTTETLRTSYNRSAYSNNKITEAISFSFRPIQETIKTSCQYYLNKYGKH